MSIQTASLFFALVIVPVAVFGVVMYRIGFVDGQDSKR